MTTIVVAAPCRGWAATLDEVPDPVFAERMMGEGLAIDPLEGLIRAPCDARVMALAPTGHSVTLALDNGAELLMHIGIDTVSLKGAGFVTKVAQGQRVATGTPLIAFDLDAVVLGAKSAMTPLVIANEGFTMTAIASGRIVESGEPLFELHTAEHVVVRADGAGDISARCELELSLANGIHARPAARIASALRPFAAEVALVKNMRRANARSTVAMLGLGLKRGDRFEIVGRGEDAQAAVAAIASLLNAELDDAAQPVAPAPAANPPPLARSGALRGVCASPGRATGNVFFWRYADAAIGEFGRGVAYERGELDRVLSCLAGQGVAGGAAGEIALAHRSLLDDPELRAAADAQIDAGKSAPFAWRAAIRGHADLLRATGDPLLIERIADLIDVERRVIAALTGVEQRAPPLDDRAILVVDDLLPSDFLALDTSKLAGICTARGGPTSHVAILAASAGVPMAVAFGDALLALGHGLPVALDAGAGMLDTQPDLKAFEKRPTARAAAPLDSGEPCRMADGTRIELFANLGSIEDASRAVAAGAEGCGLLRTEFLFLERETAPSEDEQAAAYAAIASALEGRPLIVRTLDIGGDKPVPFLPLVAEDNPALGLRGVRLTLARPALLAEQFRAILRGVPARQCRIMIPMITDAGEFAQVRAIFDEAVRVAGVSERIPLGVMIETPAAALLAESLAAEADFLSVGSNDLSQYALAMDRANPAVAAKLDPLHPAVLKLITTAALGAVKYGRQLGVCGGVASDPAAAPVLIGLGVTELSATPAAIGAVKAAVSKLDMAHSRALAERALAAPTAAAVRAILGDYE